MIIDSHTHLQFAAFDKDRQAVVKRALGSGIWFVNVGVDKESSIRAVKLANKYKEGIYASIGVHPHNADKEFDRGFFKKLALEPKVAAIGECGLDYAVFVREQPERKQKRASAEVKNEGRLQQEEIIKQRQRKLFVKQIELAREVGKPLMIHCRDAFSDLIKIFESSRHSHAFADSHYILHFFTGALDNAKNLLEMGFYFTFGGLITFNRDFDEIIKFIPLGKILLETDAPYVAPEPYRGRRNEPAYIVETAKKLAEIKGTTFGEVCSQTTENARKIFKIRV